MMGPVKQFDIYAEFKTFIYPSEYKVTLHMKNDKIKKLLFLCFGHKSVSELSNYG